MAYTGSVDLISGIRPKNNGTFPLVDAKDVYVTDDKRLDAALNDKADAADVVPKPADEGTAGQILRIDEEGKPAWSNVGTPTEEQVGDAVDAWLTAHPEATTTVQDGSITRAKLDADLKEKTDEVGELKSDINRIREQYSDDTLWEQGAITVTDGSTALSSQRIRTGFIPTAIVGINVLTGYGCGVFCWDGNTYLGSWTGTEFSKALTTWHEGEVDFSKISAYKIKLMLKNASGTSIPVSDASNVKLFIFTDKTFTKYGVPADSLETGKRLDDYSGKIAQLNTDLIDYENNLEHIKDDFRLGVYDTTGAYILSGNEYRICTTQILTYPRAITIKCKNGFSYAYDTYNNGAHDGGNRWITTDTVIPANKQFTVCIQKATPDTSEIADIPTWRDAITISTYIDYVVETIVEPKADTEDVFGTKYVVQPLPLQKVLGVSKFPNNLVAPADCVNNQYVNTTDGELNGGPSYFCTGFIPVTSGTKYRANHGRNLAWYNSSKEYLIGENGTGIQSGVTAPENAAYIRFTVNKSTDGISDPNLLYFSTFANFDDRVIIDGLISENALPWCYGKKINWIGDSIVDGQDFDEIVCDTMGLVKANEYGINGSTIALPGSGADSRRAICERYDDMSDDADIIAVSAGTNDFEYAWCPIGTINDADDGTSNRTFYGALKALCKGLIEKYPHKVIFFTTPIKRMQPFVDGNGGDYTEDYADTTPFSKNKYGKTLGDYADIIKEVCGYYSIPVLDMYRESLLNPSIAEQQDCFTKEQDTSHATSFYYYTHPNTTGQKIMARRVCGWLTQLAYPIDGLS